MRAHIVARLCALAILGLVTAGVYEWTAYSRHNRGKEAFLAYQERRFDKFYADHHPFPIGPVIGAGMLMTGTIVGLYELLAFGIHAVVVRLTANADSSEETSASKT